MVKDPFSSAAQSLVVGGIYEHYKGNRYKIIVLARHSETLEEVVVYQALHDTYDIWVRPVAMFCESIIYKGVTKKRFSLLKI